MSPESSLTPKKSGSVVWRIAWRFLKRGRRYLPRILLTILIIVVASGAKAAQTWLMKPVLEGLQDSGTAMDEGEKNEEEARDHFLKSVRWDLKLVGMVAVGLAFVMFAFGYLRDYMTNYLTHRITADLRSEVAAHLPYLPLQSHYDMRSGDLVSRLTNDITMAGPAARFFFDDALVHPIMIVCALVLVFVSNWILALVAIVGFPIYAIPLFILGKKMRKARKKSLERMADMTGVMVQTFGGIKTVKAFNREEEQVKGFNRENEGYFRKLMSAVRRKALGENLSYLFVGILIAGLLVLGGLMLIKGTMSVGDMAVLGLGVAMINSSVREIAKSYNRLLEASTGCERVFDLLDLPREEGHDSGEDVAQVDSVEYRGVTFGYNSEAVLRDVNLRVLPGEVVAVVGRTGAGKTTLLDLLCRFFDPQEGDILVSGKNLREIKRSSLLSHVSVVTQDTFLFDTTIGENIRYGRPAASQEEVEKSARDAQIHDFIAGLDQGYDTRVGERGAKLSGGQRQRIAIARAILKEPAILILDEATSSLDAESEQAVQEALDGLMHSEKRITLVIAHRLSTVRNANRILVLDKGRVAEEGRHDDLIKQDGLYASLYRTQFKS